MLANAFGVERAARPLVRVAAMRIECATNVMQSQKWMTEIQAFVVVRDERAFARYQWLLRLPRLALHRSSAALTDYEWFWCKPIDKNQSHASCAACTLQNDEKCR
jgi:hypothetical protein